MFRSSMLIACLLVGPLEAAQSITVVLAESGRSNFPIVIAPNATPQIRATAKQLLEYLNKISGAQFELDVGDGTTGIAIGTADAFSQVKLDAEFEPSETTRREEYVIRTHTKGMWLIGATDLAVRHAMWDLLYRLGYRQFFPGKNWEIVPKVNSLSIAVDALEKPCYLGRRIWYGFGPWDYAKEPYREWCEKNRCISGVELNTGHAYDGLVSGLKSEFEKHPEWWPLVNGERKPIRNPKPCLGNPDVRAAMIGQALKKFDPAKGADSISIDPSDGGGWCECPQCAKLGSVSDQAITLANELAAALQKKASGRLVGIYAYNYHSPPPSIQVHPNVVVSVATAFIKGGQTLDEIIAGWASRGATLGIREYYSVNTWDRDMPGHARGGNLAYLQQTLPAFYEKGARFLSAESSDNWGPNGLGYYFASRVLWDIREAKNKDGIVADFLEKSFGPAKAPMAEFYQQIDGSLPHLVTDDQFGRMFRALEQARKLANSADIQHRLDDLTLYARYASLYQKYLTSDPKNRQHAFENLIQFSYRMRTTMMIHSYALYRDLPNRDKSVKVPIDATHNIAEGKNPWKSSEPFSPSDITNYIQEGISSHRLVELDFKPTKYSSTLVPASPKLDFPNFPPGELGAARGVQTFHTYIEREKTVELKITGGLIAHYRDRGNVKVEAWKLGGASQSGEQETLVATDKSVPPDGNEYTVKLSLKEPGHYKIIVSDGNDRTLVTFPADVPQVIHSDMQDSINKNYGQWMAYFYVPKGTKVLGFYGGEHGEIRDSEDRPHFWLNGRDMNYYSLQIPEGQDGKVWKVRYVRGELRLLTVPPYFARTPSELLLPLEIVEHDLK